MMGNATVSSKMKFSRYAELSLLFFILPCVLYFFRHQMAFRIFLLLVLAAGGCTILLFRDVRFNRKVFRRGITPAQLRSMILVFLPAALIIAIWTYVVLPSRFLTFPTTKPTLWAIVMVLYPVLMVLPQELIFRCFFFHRYQDLFKDCPRWFITVNALSFGLSHLFYANWVAPVLSFFGGLLFAWRYLRSGSLMAVAVEHAVWGNFLFTSGIGWYFYSGSIR